MSATSATPLYPATKFQPPPGRAEHIPRSRCLRLVGDGPLAAPHVLISAQAGAGKSTLASQWAAGRSRAAWVSLGEDDDEPGQFWAAFILGVRAVVPGYGEDALPELLGGTELRRVLVELVDELSVLDGELAVVLDDLHLIGDEECHASLAWLLEHAPPNLRVAICTRADPPLPIGRLRARGQLAVLRGGDLQFDSGETVEFLAERLGLALAPRDIAAIGERTDGWAAGLYLAALSLRAGVPAQELIAGLDAGDRRVRGYVHTEVLHAIEPRHLGFLEGVSILERFSAELCDAVLERSDSRALLDELVRSNLFVIPLDLTGTWFRLHHFFGAMMRERLGSGDEVLLMHARAAVWHRAHGNVPEAIHHLVLAGRFAEAGELIAATQVIYLNSSRLGATVGRWLDLLPAGVVTASPATCIARAWVAGLGGREDEMERWLARAAALPESAGPLPDGSASAAGQVALIRGLICAQDLGAGLRQIHEAVRLESESSPWWPLVQLMVGLWGYLKEGPTDEAFAALRASDASALGAGQAQAATIAPAVLGVILLERGQPEAAAKAAARAAEMRDLFGIRRVAQTAYSWWGTSCVHLGLGLLQEALHDAEAGAAVTADVPPDRDTMFLRLPCRIQLARVRIARGELDEARAVLREVRAQVARARDPGRMAGWLAEAEAAAGVNTGGRVEFRSGYDELSERELAVLRLLAGAATLRDIAGELLVSHNTVKSHCKAIYTKLAVASRADAVARGRELGLIA